MSEENNENQEQEQQPSEAAPPEEANDNAAGQSEISKDEKMFAMLAHMLGIIAGFLAPLIIWLIKKDDSAFVNDQGKEALNFQITVLIAYIVCMFLVCLWIGGLLLPIVWLGQLILALMAGIKANEGVEYRYPVNIRFIK